MRTTWNTVGASVLLACAAVSCGGSTSPGGGAGTISEQDFPSALARTLCKNLARCCQTSGYTYDESACEAALVADYKQPLPGMKYNAQAAGACLQEFAQVASSCKTDPTIEQAVNAICDPVFAGTLQAGQSCQSDSQCAAGPNGERGACNYAPNSNSGVCVLLARGKAGDVCSDTCTGHADGSFSCSGTSQPPSGSATACYTNDNLYCSSSGTCAARLSAGQPCSSSGACASGTYCDFSSGQCAALVSVGGKCSSDEDCVASAFCNMTTGQCEARHPDSASCAGASECLSDHCVKTGSQGFCSSSVATPDMCAGASSSPSDGGPDVVGDAGP